MLLYETAHCAVGWVSGILIESLSPFSGSGRPREEEGGCPMGVIGSLSPPGTKSNGFSLEIVKISKFLDCGEIGPILKSEGLL